MCLATQYLRSRQLASRLPDGKQAEIEVLSIARQEELWEGHRRCFRSLASHDGHNVAAFVEEEVTGLSMNIVVLIFVTLATMP
ncbi:unnamed protein product [Soboliphyme baturini]|uniref:CaMKII_AD domain-containing protein n=1 Tax=Soboliphyme baturini TaxID=241478 RepID=A0A183II29_9BILA|nr:unnamed protein product [Soboliphyme baturini]